MGIYLKSALDQVGPAAIGIVVVIASVAVLVLKWLGWLQQLFAPAISIWRLIKRRIAPTDAKQSVNVRNAKDSTIITVAGDINQKSGLGPRQVNSLMRTVFREAASLLTGPRDSDVPHAEGRRARHLSKNAEPRRRRQTPIEDEEVVPSDGSVGTGNGDASSEGVPAESGAHSTAQVLAQDESNGILSFGIPPADPSGVIEKPPEILGPREFTEGVSRHDAVSLPSFEERYLFDVEPVPDSPLAGYPIITSPASVESPNPKALIDWTEPDSMTEQHSGDQAQASVGLPNFGEYLEPSECAQLQSLPEAMQPRSEAGSHDDAPVNVQVHEPSGTDAGYAWPQSQVAEEPIEPEADEDILLLGDATSDESISSAEIDTSDPVISSAQPNPAPTPLPIDERAERDALALLERYSVSDVGSILRARRTSIGLSPKDINYDQGWVDQLEAGIWPDIAGADAALARHIASYLNVVGWQAQDLHRNLSGTDEQPEQEG